MSEERWNLVDHATGEVLARNLTSEDAGKQRRHMEATNPAFAHTDIWIERAPEPVPELGEEPEEELISQFFDEPTIATFISGGLMSCLICGATVSLAERALHAKWHQQLVADFAWG